MPNNTATPETRLVFEAFDALGQDAATDDVINWCYAHNPRGLTVTNRKVGQVRYQYRKRLKSPAGRSTALAPNPRAATAPPAARPFPARTPAPPPPSQPVTGGDIMKALRALVDVHAVCVRNGVGTAVAVELLSAVRSAGDEAAQQAVLDSLNNLISSAASAADDRAFNLVRPPTPVRVPSACPPRPAVENWEASTAAATDPRE